MAVRRHRDVWFYLDDWLTQFSNKCRNRLGFDLLTKGWIGRADWRIRRSFEMDLKKLQEVVGGRAEEVDRTLRLYPQDYHRQLPEPTRALHAQVKVVGHRRDRENRMPVPVGARAGVSGEKASL